ncbi:dynamin-related GTPase DNM1 NDAI_0C02270 [Naumovozyma dairenensis CBS 421]|uniref:Uncharacterized protein n=1 Tax=Naumovozyma dairenensis (strain ATCC 10597 / BCRC 20456 / CBS 421 / NBRC 0211 / NRRL Y-12639) TaxID=1071378 RepID=G0W7X6_NAUDC|nr:hypothetical protein NDAI_0C02270 [Naumovozyma dairenensis CBS 421]CCD23887.1 hypothetical protein NDAI_0C02270 [Naumovozyma dairenensis CBS 421]
MASLEDLIPTVNKLQDVMYASGIDTVDLPILAVVGSQSSGKSSIIETLVGRDFLPRGTGIVTRRPLILQLINIPEGSDHATDGSNSTFESKKEVNAVLTETVPDANPLVESTEKQIFNEWGEFLHVPNRKFYDFNEIKREIENETARLAGKNKGISKSPINLKIFSPHVLNLTLVDLPGITKVPIGEQPPDIEKQIKNLILDYVATPNCIILAVSPANVDLVNSESLKLAKEVDPHGKRTIGVVTKLDLMDSGTNALEILSGKMYPLKLGFVGIVNRSQQDIQLNKSVKEALDNEEQYFRRHPIYRTISNRCGTRYLAKLLNRILMNHIKDKLPDIKTKLNALVTQTEQELLGYGGGVRGTKENRSGLILELMNKFSTNFISSIEGNSSNINTKELCGGARIYYIYNNIFGKSLKSLDPTTNLTVQDIRTAIRNSTGPRATLFVPELAFDLLVRPQVDLLLGPSQRCVDLVYEELMKILHSCGSSELARYPRLKSMLIDVVVELLKERVDPTRQYVESLIAIHKAYINTNHPNFLKATDAFPDIVKTHRERKTRKEKIEKERFNSNSNSNSKKRNNDPTADLDISSTDSSDEDESDDARGVKTTRDSKDSFLNYIFGKDLNNGTSQDTLSRSFGANNNKPEIMFNNLQIDDYEDDSYNLESNLTDREELECELIRRLIISYFDIIREMIQDQIPKAIMFFLVNYCKETVQNRLVTKLYKESMLEELLVEDQAIAQERANCERLLETYKNASSLVNNIL